VNEPDLRELLGAVQTGAVSLDQALAALRSGPVEDLSFARIDFQRTLRTGSPEVVFCEGKTPDQAARIFAHLAEHDGRAMATRASPAHARAICEQTPQAHNHAEARVVMLGRAELREEAASALVLVATGGTADIPVAEEAALTAAFNGCRVGRLWDVGIAGVHRLLTESQLLAEAAVIIAVAGMDGALPGVIAGLVACPVIAVPTSIGYGTGLAGVAALMNMLNACAPGVGVVNIDNGFGAGYLAASIVRGARPRRVSQ
jgi:NCAIR mutase (PurE)-related protein